MEATTAPLAPNLWEGLPAEAQRLILDLQAQVVAFRTENAALQERIRELEARLGQDSSDSSRPPSSDPPQATKPRQARLHCAACLHHRCFQHHRGLNACEWENQVRYLPL